MLAWAPLWLTLATCPFSAIFLKSGHCTLRCELESPSVTNVSKNIATMAYTQ